MLTALTCLLFATAPVRVAVLPFENATNDPQFEVLRQGLADLLVTDLTGAEPLVVVERARFEEVLAELKLQRTKAFDPAQTVRLGKVLGATHTIAGTLVAVAPEVRLAVRVVDVAKSTVLLTSSVQGAPEDLFALEEQLVQQLVAAFRAKLEATRTGHASLSSLITYAQGLDLADRGELEGAKSKFAEAVRSAPDFTLAKDRYAEMIKRLREAQKKRGTVLDESAKTLATHLTALLGKPPLTRSLGARIGLANLALLELSRAIGARRDEARYVEPGQRAEVERLEADFVLHAGALVSELRAAKGKAIDPALSEEDAKLSEKAFGLDVSTWDFASPTSVAIDLGNFLGSGWTPYRSDVPQFAVRPTAAQRSPAQLEAAKKWFDLAQKELALAPTDARPALAAKLANERAELLVLLGRREEAVAQWQGFLDAYPTAEEFPAFSKKLEAVLLLDDQAEREERQVKSCDAAVLAQGALLATRTWRAKGRAGLTALSEALQACGKKDPAFARAAWAVPAAELKRVADCEGYALHRAQAEKAGVELAPCSD